MDLSFKSSASSLRFGVCSASSVIIKKGRWRRGERVVGGGGGALNCVWPDEEG